MVSFFSHLLAPFKASSRTDSHHASEPSSQPGPYATGATIEAQTPARRRQFWQSSSTKSNSMSTSSAAKNEKPAKGEKMGTVSGVFIPTTLNVLSILMYLRYGFVLGQSGVVGMVAMLIVSYSINLLTVLSVSAIATNGKVKGGGAYYMISRSLGPEFGGSIGIVFYIGQVLNAGMNVIGFVEPLLSNFGESGGERGAWLPEGRWWELFYASLMLLVVTIISLVGSKAFSRASGFLFVVLMISSLSIPISSFTVPPFSDSTRAGGIIKYSGLSMKSLRDNLWPRFTSGAAGSSNPLRKESIASVFGVFFPATAGVFAGASMSGDLKNPSVSIPRGTLSGMGLTFFIYMAVIFSMAATVTRNTLYTDITVMQDINISPYLILMGAFSSAFFSALLGIVGCAKLLQAIARDNLLGVLRPFAQGTAIDDEPTMAVLVTYFLTQITLFSNINQIASFVTMTFLLTFMVVNLACFLLKISSAPNFRPSFHYFRWYTAFTGVVVSFLTMYFVDGVYATVAAAFMFSLFLLIHYFCPPKAWGDVTQSLIYHQVRKFLLRLDTRKEHVKFWRPQILLLVGNPRSQWQFIQFCNALKKGALYIIGHIIVTNDFNACLQEIKKQKSAWLEFIRVSGVKAFHQVAISPSEVWGMRNLVLNAGLGGLYPNLIVMGFFSLDDWRNLHPLSKQTSEHNKQLKRTTSHLHHTVEMQLPTDDIRTERPIAITTWVNIVEDILLGLNMNIAIGKGMDELELPMLKQKRRWFMGREYHAPTKKYIDLWPIQMSAELTDDGGRRASQADELKKNLVTSNFDTYTMILQMGYIIHSVPAWKQAYQLRVILFVENPQDVEEEKARVQNLLENLRIDAILVVLCLSSTATYRCLINGDVDVNGRVEDILGEDGWWQDLKQLRSASSSSTPMAASAFAQASRAFRNSLVDFSPSNRTDFAPGPLARRTSVASGSRPSISVAALPKRRQSMAVLPQSFSMRMGVGKPGYFSHVSSESSSSEESDNGEDSASDFDHDFDEAVASDDSIEESVDPLQKTDYFSRSASRHSKPGKSPLDEIAPGKRGAFSASAHASLDVDDDDRPHVSFKSTPHPHSHTHHHTPELELDFNILPARAQYLILNDLIKSYSEDTAVVFTTLPAPAQGTYQDEEKSLEYVGGLELLCEDIPPVLLIHSNSLVVTLAL